MARAWTKAHENRIAQALKAMAAHATAFEDMSPAAVEDRKRLPFPRWCQVYLPHHFLCAFGPPHERLLAALDEPTMPTWAAMARGMGKSTINSLAAPLSRTLNKRSITGLTDVHFQIFGALTEDLACNLLDHVRLELENNERLIADYGARACAVHGTDEEWIANGVMMLALGVGQTPRGRRHGPYRPDVAVLDDLEDRFTAKNPKRSQELRDLIFQDWIPALEPDKWIMTLCLTALGRTGLLAWAQQHERDKDPSGRSLYKLIFEPMQTADGMSAWPERFPDLGLGRIRAMVGLRAWNQEYMLRSDDPDAPFKPGWFKEFDSRTIDRTKLRIVAFLDPSAKSDEQHDFKALAVLATPTADAGPELIQGASYCLHAWVKRATPKAMIAALFDAHNVHGAAVIGCEANGFQSLIWELLDIEMRERGQIISVRPITNTASKADRILSNQAIFERGLCFFDPNEGDQQVLVDQFLDFDKASVHDDGPDAWDGARRLLPGGANNVEFFYQGLGRGAGDPRDMFGGLRPRAIDHAARA